jgi:hypothetical protein
MSTARFNAQLRLHDGRPPCRASAASALTTQRLHAAVPPDASMSTALAADSPRTTAPNHKALIPIVGASPR